MKQVFFFQINDFVVFLLNESTIVRNIDSNLILSFFPIENTLLYYLKCALDVVVFLNATLRFIFDH